MTDEHNETIRRAEELALANGTDNQRERYAAGLLPEDELLQLARPELFRQFPFLRWAGSRDRDRMTRLFQHGKLMGRPCDRDPNALEFETCELGEITAEEWEMYKKFTTGQALTNKHHWLDSGAVRIEPSQHWITCKQCGAETYKISVKVTIRWAGRDLVREYLLDPSKLPEYEGVPA